VHIEEVNENRDRCSFFDGFGRSRRILYTSNACDPVFFLKKKPAIQNPSPSSATANPSSSPCCNHPASYRLHAPPPRAAPRRPALRCLRSSHRYGHEAPPPALPPSHARSTTSECESTATSLPPRPPPLPST
jgi:hypothetical protein